MVAGYRALQRDAGRSHGSHGLQTSFRNCQHTVGAPGNLPLSVPAAQKAGVVVEMRKPRQQRSLPWKGGGRKQEEMEQKTMTSLSRRKANVAFLQGDGENGIYR